MMLTSSRVDGARRREYCKLFEFGSALKFADTRSFKVEFGSPSVLLKNEKGFLRALVDESGDRDKLYAMVAAAGGSSA